ncbi:MAG: flagellar basal-body rod protein FlgG [Candidatus Cloacimonadota bacterium]|nr:flagellar basal-body rod protein FlgG [Candidatus Cloacimonadota bacterium]
MFRSLQTAATGMKAQELIIDTITNNLSNVNTTGFKKSRINFQDLMYKQLNNATQQTENPSPAGLEVGYGTKPIDSVKDFSQGVLTQTERSLDVAINGEGLFRIMKPNGEVFFSRDGSFQVSSDGTLVTADGYIVQPDIIIPENTQEITISKQGIVNATYPGDPLPEELGQIELSKFINPVGLRSAGDNLYEATPAAGEELIGYPGELGFGEVNQGYLEKSNVSVVEEMMKMIVAQRSYEVISKSIKTSEEMMKISNNIK